MKVPWKSTPTQVGDADTVVVQVSKLELAHLKDVPGFLVTALRIRRWVLRAEGAVGMSLIAHPLKRTFWTLSAWQNEAAIGSLMTSELHRTAMTKYQGRMSDSHFHTWHPTDPALLPPDWDAAQTRLLSTKEDE